MLRTFHSTVLSATLVVFAPALASAHSSHHPVPHHSQGDKKPAKEKKKAAHPKTAPTPAKPAAAPTKPAAAPQKPASEPAKPAAAPAKPTPAPAPAKPAEASTAKSAAPAPIHIALSGATPESMPKIVSALQAVSHSGGTEWKCPQCSATQATKGQCAKCKVDLVESRSTVKAATEVKSDATGALSFTLAPGQSLSLDELDRAARGSQASISRASIAVPAYSRLYFSAPADTKDARGAIETALTNSKLFTHVGVRFDESRKQYVGTVEGVQGAPTYGAVSTAIHAAGPGYALQNLAWTAPCDTCRKAGHTAAACKACWPDYAATIGVGQPHG